MLSLALRSTGRKHRFHPRSRSASLSAALQCLHEPGFFKSRMHTLVEQGRVRYEGGNGSTKSSRRGSILARHLRLPFIIGPCAMRPGGGRQRHEALKYRTPGMTLRQFMYLRQYTRQPGQGSWCSLRLETQHVDTEMDRGAIEDEAYREHVSINGSLRSVLPKSATASESSKGAKISWTKATGV